VLGFPVVNLAETPLANLKLNRCLSLRIDSLHFNALNVFVQGLQYFIYLVRTWPLLLLG
jgi:hypothetical protein